MKTDAAVEKFTFKSIKENQLKKIIRNCVKNKSSASAAAGNF